MSAGMQAAYVELDAATREAARSHDYTAAAEAFDALRLHLGEEM